MTPPPIADFMASLLPRPCGSFHLLDPGAGEGSLSSAFLKSLRQSEGSCPGPGPGGECSVFEIDAEMLRKWEEKTAPARTNLPLAWHVYHTDFIAHAASLVAQNKRPFSHAILNPPYKKIHSKSPQQAILRAIGLETVNLYTAFVALAVALLQNGGHLVAIIPRSFCNGPYYKTFRNFILRHAAIRQIHLFTSRTQAFKADKVLQETLIIHLERDAQQADILISSSSNGDMADYTACTQPFTAIVKADDTEQFIHIPNETRTDKTFPKACFALSALGLEVSTGPVVDFRLKEYLRDMPQDDDAPLLYPGHFTGRAEWPRPDFKKANAIACCAATQKWLYPTGCYVLVRRVSSKEEKRRIVANFIDPLLCADKPWLGFENHLNVFHCRKKGLPKDLARGLALYLNSQFIDTLFRRFSGHTQVNAADLRALPYPSASILTAMGLWAEKQQDKSQDALEQDFANFLA